ncbi:MAG: hypothetical protein ACMUIG_04080 [Thermoplasmatota archaeon]
MRRSFIKGKRNDTSGVSNIVSIIMLAGIITSLLGMIFTTYLPAFGKDIEAQTLNESMVSFMDLKSSVDILAVRGDEGTAMSSTITLGSVGGPVFGFGRCSGSFRLDTQDGLVQVQDQTGYAYGRGRGTIKYDSRNTYVDEQVITLEAGAIIREQLDQSVVKGSPNMIVTKDDTTDEVVMYLLLTTIEGDDQSYSGTGTYMISMTLLSEELSSYTIAPGTTLTLTVNTDYNTLWEDLFVGIMNDEGIPAGDYTTDTSVADEFSLDINNVDRLEIRTAVLKLSVA